MHSIRTKKIPPVITHRFTSFAFLSHGGAGSEVGIKFSGRDVICVKEKFLS
jgi:hypothetical protein